MNSKSTFVAGFVCSVALLGNGPTAAAPPNLRYIDAASGFSFQPPDGWLKREGLPKPLVAYIGPQENGFSVNFSVNIYGKRVKKTDEEKFLRDIKIEHGTIYDRKRVKLANRPAHAWRTRLNVPNYPKLENRMVLCFHNERAYELTFTVAPASLKKYEPVYNRILASFQFEKAVADAAAPKPKL